MELIFRLVLWFEFYKGYVREGWERIPPPKAVYERTARPRPSPARLYGIRAGTRPEKKELVFFYE